MMLNKVLPTVFNTLMDSCHHFAALLSFFRAFFGLGELALRFGQRLFLFSEKSGILDLFARGEIRKGVEPHVHAHLVLRDRHRPGVNFPTIY